MRELLENLRRRPHGPAEWIADGVRLLAVASIVVAGIGWGVQGALSLAFVTVGMLLPRALGVRPAFDIAFGIVALVSVWSSVTDLYITVKWWDLPMHFLLTGLVAALCYVLLVRFGVVADHETLRHPLLSATIVTTALGTSFAALWELWEWFAKNYVDHTTYVGYRDTIGDMAQGVLGALLAGLLMRVLTAHPRRAGGQADAATAAGRAAATPDRPPVRPA
ncbi:hypothetical protein ACFPER_10820 [Agromyces aurantiacus]|uniref:DUF2238 domain-containing protein n=2 Tax=Agromyces aurantiacus TaxID=165814 RepID=A0ABV9RAU8_9MICO|nr:hypothetical protein [Agromyces aurantiacus]